MYPRHSYMQMKNKKYPNMAMKNCYNNAWQSNYFCMKYSCSLIKSLQNIPIKYMTIGHH